MRLLFYIHAITGGGGERVLSKLVNEFVRRGEDVHLATRMDIMFSYKISEDVVLHDLYEGTCSDIKLYDSFRLRRNVRNIARAVQPDVIIAFMSAMGCMVLNASLGLGFPVIVSEHTNISRKLGCLLNIKRAISYPFAAAVTVLTKHDKEILKHKKNIVYLPNPIDLENKESIDGERSKVILAVGRVNQWEVKGFDNLLRCWGHLCRDFPDWRLQIAGDADIASREYLNLIAKEAGCINYEFLGFRDDIDVLMKKSAVFCLSSRVEGLPMALIEAMNYGCCCVSFDVLTGPNEIIEDNISGLLVKNQDTDDLIAKLRSVLKDDDLRSSLAQNAPVSVKKYSIEKVMEMWYQLLNQVRKDEMV